MNKWWMECSPHEKRGAELADSFLIRDDTVILFEHKGQRYGYNFMKGISCDLVLGPSNDVLNEIDKGGSYESSDVLRNELDKDLLTKGMWQQTKSSLGLLDWVNTNFGISPKKVYPIITYLAELHVDEVCRNVYINPLIDKSGLHKEEYWQNPQWINIEELEMIVDMVEKGEIGFEDFLKKKLIESPNDHFDIYIKSKYSKKFYNKYLHEIAMKMLLDTMSTFLTSI